MLPLGDVKTAEHLGRRVAEAAIRWRAGADAKANAKADANADANAKANADANAKANAKANADANANADPLRHEAARSWAFPPVGRAALSGGVERANLREMVARPDFYARKGEIQ